MQLYDFVCSPVSAGSCGMCVRTRTASQQINTKRRWNIADDYSAYLPAMIVVVWSVLIVLIVLRLYLTVTCNSVQMNRDAICRFIALQMIEMPTSSTIIKTILIVSRFNWFSTNTQTTYTHTHISTIYKAILWILLRKRSKHYVLRHHHHHLLALFPHWAGLGIDLLRRHSLLSPQITPLYVVPLDTYLSSVHTYSLVHPLFVHPLYSVLHYT